MKFRIYIWINRVMRFKNIIIILLLLFCFNVNICSGNSYINNDINIELPYSKSNNIEYNISYTDFDKYTSKEAFYEIIRQETELKKLFMQNKSAEFNDSIFETFYQNLYYAVKQINKSPNEIQSINTGLFRKTQKNNIEINFSYISDNYSKYLSNPYKKYFELKKYEQVQGKNQSASRNFKADYIIKLREIINSYPDFDLWYDVLEDIKISTDAFIFINQNETNMAKIKDEYKKLLNSADENTYEYYTIDYFNNILSMVNTLDEYNKEYKNWHERTFWDETPIITQAEMNEHAELLNGIEEKKFREETNKLKQIKLNDNGAFSRYLNDYEKRKKEIENVVFPLKDTNPWEYGSIFPVELYGLYNSIYELELYTYKKIIAAYKGDYEHSDTNNIEKYRKYYDKVKSNILKSENFAQNMKKYIADYKNRESILRNILPKTMSKEDFDVFNIKLELYTYYVILNNLGGCYDYSDEIKNIF